MSDSDLVIANNLADVSMDSVFDNQSSCTTRSETTYSNSSVCSSVPLFPTPTPCFATCSYEELWREMKKENLDVQFVMELRILLNLYKWDENVLLEKLTGNEATLKKLYDSAKLPFKRVLKAFKTFRQLETLECDVCLSDCDSSMMLNLHCGHFFCKVCMNGTIKQKVYDRQQVMFCLSDCCEDIITDDVVLDLLTEQQYRVKFQKLMFESYVQNKNYLGWWPGRDCNRIFKIKTFFSTASSVCNIAILTPAKNSETCTTKRDESKKSLKRYIFYSDRYNQQKQSLILEEKLNSDEGLKDEGNPEAIRVYNRQQMFLKDAIRVLKACRTTLMNTYAFAYFLQKNNQSEMFENNQSDLQKHVEILSEFLERDVHKYPDDHTTMSAVKDKVKYCDERRKKLVDHVKECDWEYKNL